MKQLIKGSLHNVETQVWLKLIIVFVLLSMLISDTSAQILDYATDTRLSADVRAFLKEVNKGAGLETMSANDARKVLEDAQSGAKVDLSGITISDKIISSGGYKVKLKIVRPEGAKGVLPVFIFIHGGGWVLGDFPTHERMVRDLVVESGFVAVFVDYTRTPDAAYPQAINEIYAALQWVSEHGSEIQVDGKKLAVIGNSVGGNMTGVMSLMAKAKHGPEIKLSIMLWPIVDANFDTESYKAYGDQRYLTKATMMWMYDMYIPDPEKRKDIYASPLRATVDQLKGLPPTMIFTAENDVLRDEGEAYGRKLDEAGVTEVTVRYNGMIHDWGLLNGLANTPQTKSLFIRCGAELKKYLK
jgi:acetyl esterase